MRFVIILLVVATQTLLAQQGGTPAKPAEQFAGNLYEGLGREMIEAQRIWTEVNKSFDDKYRSFLTSNAPVGRSPICTSQCKEDLEQARRAHEVFVRKKTLFYEQHLREANKTVDDRRRDIAKRRERVANLELALGTATKDLEALQEQMKALDMVPGGGGEKLAETRSRLLNAIRQQREIVVDLQNSKGNADATLEGGLKVVEDATYVRDENKRYVTGINANNEYWQSHYDLRAAQFDLLCPPALPPPPPNPRPK